MFGRKDEPKDEPSEQVSEARSDLTIPEDANEVEIQFRFYVSGLPEQPGRIGMTFYVSESTRLLYSTFVDRIKAATADSDIDVDVSYTSKRKTPL